MDVSVKQTWRKVTVLVSFIIMVAVNALANTLPLNGVMTGAVADRYQNLFTPAPLTFGIWGVIYLLLLIYVVFQLIPVRDGGDPARQLLLNKVSLWFGISSLLNAGWIFAWHYDQIPLTMVFMVLLLLALMRVGWLLRAPHCSPREEMALRLPFGVYFGWITVATIANVTVLLRSLNWDALGLSEPVWTVLILVIGVLIASFTMYRIRNVGYGLAVLWAFTGILIRHISPLWYGGQYTQIITVTIAALAVLFVALVMTAIHMRKVAACTIETPESN